jgi:ubiquinol-cytochrome c reductase iron-sulfur subunit
MRRRCRQEPTHLDRHHLRRRCRRRRGGRSALRQHLRAVGARARRRCPVQVDISALRPGEKLTVEWRGKPVWIVRRTPEQLESLKKLEAQLADPNSKRTQYPTPEYAKNQHRSIKPEFFVGVGICSHLGCSPSDKFQTGAQPSLPDDWAGGFLCPCHGSTFDIAGRVFKNKPAPDNLEVPPHMYLSDTAADRRGQGRPERSPRGRP